MIKPFEEKICFLELTSETEKCHPDFGDGRKNWQDNGFYVFEKGGRWFVALDRDEHGNYTTDLTISKILEWTELLGDRKLLGKEDLPEDVIEEVWYVWGNGSYK